MDIKRASAYIVYMFYGNKTGLGASVNQELVQEPHKPVIKKMQKKVNLCEI